MRGRVGGKQQIVYLIMRNGDHIGGGGMKRVETDTKVAEGRHQARKKYVRVADLVHGPKIELAQNKFPEKPNQSSYCTNSKIRR